MSSVFWNYMYLLFILSLASVLLLNKGNRRISLGDSYKLELIDYTLQSLILCSILVAILSIYFDLLSAYTYQTVDLLRWLGVIMAVSTVLTLYQIVRAPHASRFESRRSTKVQNEQLGIYRKIRHPLFTAILLSGLSQLFLLPNWLVGPSLLVFSLPLAYRQISRNESFMLRQCGSEYTKYCAQTNRLLPNLTNCRHRVDNEEKS